jgi:hypothetical protein
MPFAVDISGIADQSLEFVGYFLVEENEEFKIFRDKYGEDHIVQKSDGLLYVDELDQAQSLGAGRVVMLHGL